MKKLEGKKNLRDPKINRKKEIKILEQRSREHYKGSKKPRDGSSKIKQYLQNISKTPRNELIEKS